MFSLSAVEKVTLARDHKVARWLVEGLTCLVSEDLSPDELEEAVGARTAFRLVTIRYKSFSSSLGSPIFINGAKRTGFSAAAVHCGNCAKPFFNEEFKCQSCASIILKGTPGSIYMGSTSGATGHTHSGIGDCFHLNLQQIYCSLCSRRVIVGNTSCSSCARVLPYISNILLSLCCELRFSVPVTEALVRDLFKDEIREYDI